MIRSICLLIILLPVVAMGQDEPMAPSRKNVIKLALTPNVFYQGAIVPGYERVLKNNQTINVVAGLVTFPVLFEGHNSMRAEELDPRPGFMAAVDYRFYLMKENKYAPPRGIYLAPFISYYHFRGDWNLYRLSTGSTADAQVRADLAFLNIGGQIGYQFIVKDRLTFDFIFFGPSITQYRLDMNMQGNLNGGEQGEVVEEILDRFPLLAQLIDENSITVNGNNSTWSMGYRFTCMIGYSFGKR